MSGDVQRLTIDRKGRVETGPVQFNDDWPGVFLRGDTALFFAAVLRGICRFYSEANLGLKLNDAERLARLLESCDARQAESSSPSAGTP